MLGGGVEYANYANSTSMLTWDGAVRSIDYDTRLGLFGYQALRRFQTNTSNTPEARLG